MAQMAMEDLSTLGSLPGPKVSIVMPAYNSARDMRETIRPVQHQSFHDWELIIVDDGSTDDTPKVLEQVLVDCRIRIAELPRNLGRGTARNIGIAMAKGKYIAFWDSDDLSHPDRLSRQFQHLETFSETDVVSSQMMYFSETTPPHHEFLFPTDMTDIRRRFSRGQMAVPFAPSMMRKEVLDRFGGFSGQCRREEDLEFFLRIYPTTVFHVLPDSLYLYRHETRAIGLKQWIKESFHHRYAVYHAAQVRNFPGSEVVSFDTFRRSLRTRLAIFTIDMLRYANYRLKLKPGGARLLK